MSSTTTDRLAGVSSGLGMKAPVRVATTANITLSGLQTIDGVTVVADDRVLVKDQTDTTTNGIYAASSGVWVRSKDFDGSRDIVEGTCVIVSNGTDFGNTFWKVTTANPAIGSALVFGRITSQVEDEVTASQTVAESYADILHADAYATLALAQAALADNKTLLLKSGETTAHSAGRFATWPDNFVIQGDSELRAVIDFSGNATYHNDGLIKIHGSLNAATEQSITKSLGRTAALAHTSLVYASGTITATTIDDHPFSTGDELFVYAMFSMTAGQAAFLTMKDSDEGMALSLPVTITKTGANTYTYAPPNGGTPDASFTSASAAYCRLNDLYVGVSSTTGYTRGDMVHIQSDDTYGGYNGSVTLDEGENNEIEYIQGSGFWLTQPVKFSYVSNPKVTKVNAKTVVARNIEIVGTGGSSTNTNYGQADIAFDLKWTRNCIFENVVVRDCDYAGFKEAQSLGNVYIDPPVYFDKLNAGGAASGFIEIQYGMWFSSGSRDAKVVRSKVFNGRHAITEACISGDGPGRVINLQIIGADWHNQWSATFATHDMYDHILLENIKFTGGQGINIRDGNMTLRNIHSEGSQYVIYSYGKIENLIIDGVYGKNIGQMGIRLTPTNKAVASPYYEGALPYVKNVHVSNVYIEGARYGIYTTCNPNTTDNPTFYWEDFSFENIRGRDINYNVLTLLSGGSNTYAYKNGSIRGVYGKNTDNFVTMSNPIDVTVEDVRGLDAKAGAICVVVAGASAANNTFNNIRGKYVGGADMTVFDMVTTSTGNKTDSIPYENKTIASGAITKNFRNVPMVLVDTEGAAASDDLTDINGLVHGDVVILRANSSARDVVVKHGSGDNKTAPGYDITLSDSSALLTLVNNGSTLVRPLGQTELQGTTTYDPASLVDGAGVTTTVTVTGAAVGDFARVSFSNALQGILMTAWVSAADTVSVRFQNETTGTIDLASGTLRARVEKAT